MHTVFSRLKHPIHIFKKCEHLFQDLGYAKHMAPLSKRRLRDLKLQSEVQLRSDILVFLRGLFGSQASLGGLK
jgi:hypothetical protein